MIDVEKFKQLSYKEQLKLLMEEARKAKDIYAMLKIADKMRDVQK